MAKKTTERGLSNRQYAKGRCVSEAAIRRRRADGTLADAVLPNGRLDPEKADELLAKGTTAGHRQSKDLSEARRRKAAAAVALLADDVAALKRAVATIDDASTCVREFTLHCAERLWRLSEVAPECMGKSAAEAAGIVQEAVIVALEDLSGRSRYQFNEIEDPEPQQADAATDEPQGPPLDKLSAVKLATMRADLEAEKLEVERALNRGTLVRIEAVLAMLGNKLANCRSQLLGLHARTGPQLGVLNDAAEAQAYLARELKDAIAELATEFITVAELVAVGPLAKRTKEEAA